MKLRTLKDLKRKWEYDAGLDAVVPFKGGKPIGCSNDIVIFDELKAEAIKWIKLIEKDCPDRYEHYLGEIYGLVNWIKDFFNITEEELSK